MSDLPPPLPTPAEIVRAYHARTRHRFEAYAEGPGQLDWDAQPAAFRHYPGAPALTLPLAADRHERPYAALHAKPDTPVQPGLGSLGALLELSFGLSAWKSWGPNRWALRCNPSSGNLHPVEAYVLASSLPDIPDGLHHYDPAEHALEWRACPAPGDQPPRLLVGLSSVMWREAWKYGERAFRYCQLDVGHAQAALAFAGALLGWEIEALPMAGEPLARLLGVDREEDFPPSRYAFTESEEPEILLAVRAPGLFSGAAGAGLEHWLDKAQWHGRPSRIDASPGYRWPVIAQVATASRAAPAGAPPAAWPDLPPLAPSPSRAGIAEIIRRRRSAQRFDPRQTLPRNAFYRLLDATLPRPQAPFTSQQGAPRLHLLLFVLRVEGLPSGLYLLPRTAAGAGELNGALGEHFAGRRPVGEIDATCPAHLGLVQLAEIAPPELQRLARAVSCHQDIASTSAFSLGMLGDLERATEAAHGYRELFREAGLIGQVLYLEAEAAGVRGTGIGCFFDDPAQAAGGLAGTTYRSVYHFTVGTPIDDARLETGPPYPQRHQDPP